MPASVSLHSLSWATPDGRILFDTIDTHFGCERTGLVGRNGVGKSTLLHLINGDLAPRAGSVTVNGSAGLMRQIVQPGEAETVAGLFGIARALDILRRAAAGEASVEELSDADWTLEARLSDALAATGLDVTPETRLVQLSGGQRTRVALSALVFGQPDFLLLDEPTNNLDREGRAAVAEFLDGWKAGAIIVSHDRELLERMDAIVELTGHGATRYGGNWSRYRELKALELAAAEKDLADSEKHAAGIARVAQQRAERKAKKDSAGRNKRAKGDAPRILLDARKERAEATGGGNARLAADRAAQAGEAVAAARKKIEILQPFTLGLPSTGLPAGRTVLAFDRVTAGYDPAHPVISNASFTMIGPERVALTGCNGAGKTTMLKLICGQLQAFSGDIRVPVRFAVLDQQVSILDPAASVLENFCRLNPGCGENACRAALARFMFRTDAALQRVSTLSGGQVLRAGLACVLGGEEPPGLLILDEPTNHLDIDSIAVVEAGLRAFDGALLVVSHDEAFLDAIGIDRRQPLPMRTPAASTSEPPSTT